MTVAIVDYGSGNLRSAAKSFERAVAEAELPEEIIVTSVGKNIAPNDIETQIKTSPFVSQAVMVGDGRKYCVALVSINEDAAKTWIAREHIPQKGQLHEVSELKERIWSHVQKVNQALAKHETIKKIYLVPEDFSVDNGMLTPTFKIKRPVVEQHYAKEIDSLY